MLCLLHQGHSSALCGSMLSSGGAGRPASRSLLCHLCQQNRSQTDRAASDTEIYCVALVEKGVGEENTLMYQEE